MAVTAVLIVGGGLGVGSSQRTPHGVIGFAEAAGAVQATEVGVAVVNAQPVTERQGYSGRLQAIEDIAIRPLVSGTLVGVHFKDGSLVKRGDVLFSIDPKPYQAEVDRAAGVLAASQARVAFASSDAARAERLIASNAISKRDLDEKVNALRETQANVKTATAALDAANINLGYTRVKAPVAGRVSRAELTVGNTVASGASAPVLTTLVSVSPIYAAFDVDEQTYLAYLCCSSGAPVPVSLGLANETGYSRSGVIDSVDNQMNSGSGTIRVRARFDNLDGALLPGLYARIQVSAGRAHDRVLINDAAVGTDQTRKYVLVVDEQERAQYRQVELGNLHDGLRIVLSGLQPGERIIVNGVQRVRPQEKVSVQTVDMANLSPSIKPAA
ncbi:efflux RND transporter periplasmic adaptor subunit [Pseudomonas sp. NPDC088368]|uniref:efflux RND transporter periplasmic adaptor subunit n=1 Tax=Pseudomonas sp. NPDC088368 TaxID=3364453 RepID=UPI00380494BA